MINLIRALKVNSHCGVGQIGQYFSHGEYSNYLFYEVSKRFNNLLSEQNPTRYSEKQLEILRLVQSLHKYGLGYRRIAKVLNEKGLTTEKVTSGGIQMCIQFLKDIQNEKRD